MIAPAQVSSNAKAKALEWVTPDDFLVRLEPADPGQRVAAFLADTGLLLGVTIVLYLITAIPAFFLLHVWADAAMISWGFVGVAQFLLWNGYWVWFEWRRMGMTLGKRWVGIQVIRPEGGTLSLASVLTRSMAREVEIWMPLKMLIFKQVMLVQGGNLFLWSFALLLIPLLNKGRRRAGDYAAGTWVVRRPPWPELKRELLKTPKHEFQAAQAPRWTFTTAMLEIYGTTQLNALQEVLDGSEGAGSFDLLIEIKDRVLAKIDHPETVSDREAKPFLLAFYRAMREHLESRLASGRSTIKTLKKSHAGGRRAAHWFKRFESPE